MSALQQVVPVCPKLSSASSKRAVRNVSDYEVLQGVRWFTGGVSEEDNYGEAKGGEESPKLICAPFTWGWFE